MAYLAEVANDELLYQAVDSDHVTNVFRLIQRSHYKVLRFSNLALSRSLIYACRKGHELLVRYQLMDCKNLEVRDDAGNTPLMICAEEGRLELLEMLLAQGANVNARNDKGDSALILANSSEIIHHLLSHCDVNVNHQNLDGYTALMVAIETCNIDKAKLLIKFVCFSEDSVVSADVKKINLSLRNRKGQTALQIAHRVGLGSIVKLFVSAQKKSRHPLLLAAVMGDFLSCNTLLTNEWVDKREVVNIQPNILFVVLKFIKINSVTVGCVETDLVRKLCEFGVKIRACSNCAGSSFRLVLDIDSYDLAEVLCQHAAKIPHRAIVSLVEESKINFIPLFAKYGAEMNQSDESGSFKYPDSALDVALRNSKIDYANALLSNRAKIDLEYALIQALTNSNCGMLEFLIDHKQTEIQKIVSTKQDLFNKEVTHSNIAILELLLKAGADVNGVFCDKTPLMNAMDPEVIRFLIQNGADINKRTKTTALINSLSRTYLDNIINTVAPKSNYNNLRLLEFVKEIVSLLIDSGADVETTDDVGTTVLIESVKNLCHGEIVQILLDRGAKVNAQNRSGQTAMHTVLGSLNFSYLNAKHLYLYEVRKFMNIYEGVNSVISYSDSRILELVKLLLLNNANVNVEDCLGNTPLLHAIKENKICSSLMVSITGLLLSSGANVDHRNNFGMSTVMMAAQNNIPGLLSFLLMSGANVNFVCKAGQSRKTALSILLNNEDLNSSCLSMASELLSFGAKAKYVHCGTLQALIESNKRSLVHKLISAGLPPTEYIYQGSRIRWPARSISPLGICLMSENLALATYFTHNWFLTKSDIKILSGNKTYFRYAGYACRQFLTEASSRPLSLSLLSFLSVSSSLGTDPVREERIKRLSLPRLLKDALMFKKVSNEIFLDDEDSG